MVTGSLMMVRAVVREEFDDVREETVVNEKSGDAEKKTVKAEEELLGNEKFGAKCRDIQGMVALTGTLQHRNNGNAEFLPFRDDAYQHYDMPYSGGRGGGPGQMQMGGHNRHPWGHGATPEMGSLPPHQDFTVTVAPNR